MNTQAPAYIDSSLQTFEADVITASASQLVLVDFWASWCGPCQSLGPILEKLVMQYQGAIKLVKIDTDAEQGLAAQFGVRSLPTVYFFKDGQVVDQFMGVQPESQIKAMIDKHTMSPIEADLEMVENAYQDGHKEQAIQAAAQMLQHYPGDDRPKLLLLQWMVDAGDLEQAGAIADSLPEEAQNKPAYKAFEAAKALGAGDADKGDTGELLRAIEKNPTDLAARFQLAKSLIQQQDYAGGMDQLLEIIKQDREFEDDGARKLMITVFELLGNTNPVVSEYRSKLSRTLF